MHPFRTADFVSPHPEESTAYIVLLMERMAEIARELDRSQDAEEFSRCAGAAREASKRWYARRSTAWTQTAKPNWYGRSL